MYKPGYSEDGRRAQPPKGGERGGHYAPTPSNTGALTPKVLIDALSFTLHGDNAYSDSNWLLGPEGWEKLPYGKNGYSSAERRGNLFRYYDGRAGMGVHVTGMGQACRELEASGCLRDWPSFLGAILKSKGKFSRLDVAVDDHDGQLDIYQILDDTLNGLCVSPMKLFRVEQSGQLSSGDKNGLTIYYGSFKSDSFVRIYDKAAEQNLEDEHWIRVEMEFKNDMAQKVAEYAIHNEDLLYLQNVLYRQIDFKERGTEQQKYKWRTASYWRQFLDGLLKVKLSTKPERKVCEEVVEWLTSQIAPSLAMVLEANGGDYEVIDNLIRKGSAKMKPRHRAIIKEAQTRHAKNDTNNTES